MNINFPTKGFTLIETLVAIAIIMVAITGPFAATENAIYASNISRNKSVATFLAQEGIEYIHAVRDKVYIKECFSASGANCSTWWDNFTTSSSLLGSGYNVLQCTGSIPCTLDMTKSNYALYGSAAPPFASRALTVCTVNTCGKLYLTPTYEYTTSSGNTPTLFSRQIVTTGLRSTTGLGNITVKVKVTVTWEERGSKQSVVATDVLTSWE